MDPGYSFLAPLESEFRDDEAERWRSHVRDDEAEEVTLSLQGDEAERLRFSLHPQSAGFDSPASVGAGPTHLVIPEAS